MGSAIIKELEVAKQGQETVQERDSMAVRADSEELMVLEAEALVLALVAELVTA